MWKIILLRRTKIFHREKTFPMMCNIVAKLLILLRSKRCLI